MKVGVALAHPPPGASSAGWNDIAALAVEAESLGLAAVWLDDGAPVAGATDGFDALAALAALSRTTRRVRLGVAGPLVAGRPPGIVAKALSTIDVLSGGRLLIALSAGPGIAESLAILRGAFTGEVFDFAGDLYTVNGLRCQPRPHQRPGPPLWVQGIDESTVEVAATGGDGWLATPENLEEFIGVSRHLDERCAELGRDPITVARAATVGMAALAGDPAEALAGWRSAGASHLVVGLQALPFGETRTVLRLLASAIR